MNQYILYGFTRHSIFDSKTCNNDSEKFQYFRRESMDLAKALRIILSEKSTYPSIKNSLDFLHHDFSGKTGIYAGDLTFEKGTNTKNGWVVSPVMAAHCLIDLERTRRFLKGIHKAIEDYLKKNKQIRILYAGCGPYATLLTPFTTLYTPEQLRFTFLEINEESVVAVKRLYETCDLISFLDDIILADATSSDIQFENPFHIIISETMQMALRKECQVPITRNLVKFLTPDGTFIPERISLDVYLTGSLDPLKPRDQKKEYVGTAYELDFRNVPEPNHKTVITVPSSELVHLQLFTEIYLYGGEKLTLRQSSLTQPLTLDRLKNKRSPAIQFTYTEGPRPELVFEYIMDY